MTHGQWIEIQLVNDLDEPVTVADVVVAIHFFTKGRYRYAFEVGRTDQSGQVRASYDYLEDVRRKNAADNLMDYNTKLDECDERVRIAVPSETDLRRQFDSAMRFYQTPPSWAEHWPANGRVRSAETVIELSDGLNRVKLPVR